MPLSVLTPALDDSLQAILALYDEGRSLDAWEIAQRLGPLHEWSDPDARVMGGRLAVHLGAPRLSALLHLRTFRTHPTHPDAQYYYLYRVRERRGALVAWQERQRLGEPDGVERDTLADYHGQCAQLLGALRDFDRAGQHLARSLEAQPTRPYWHVERAMLYEMQDRYDEALQAARDGLVITPRYPPLVSCAAHCLQLHGKNEEALELLRWAAADSQSSYVVGDLLRLVVKLRRLDEIPGVIERYEAVTPLREKAVRNWLASIRAEMSARRGDYAAAMEQVERIDDQFFRGVTENLRAFLAAPAPRPPRRVELPVAFVRQHHLTCAPATLSALSRFWQKPAEHLSIAEEICYDGTQDYSERNWADRNEWATMEFRVDWNAAVSLLDRGVPFTLTLSDVATGHLQAVIGYDEPTGIFLVRDPFIHETLETNAPLLLRSQASTGPRGMAMVPAERADLLDGLTLPESELYDLYHRLQLALDRHDRDGALEQYARLKDRDPAHRLTLMARRVVAGYDDNPREALAAIDALLALFPDDQRLHLLRLASMRHIASREERLSWLAFVCERRTADALLWVEYAIELKADDRRIPEALTYVHRALRRRPDDAHVVHELAGLVWLQGRHEEASELFRFAACLAQGREDYAHDYFTVCRWRRQVEAGLDFLRARMERAGAQSGAPAMTLFAALDVLGRGDEAFAVLDAAIAERPDDGALRLFAANKHSQYGRVAEARRHLSAAEGRAKRTDWLAEAAREARLAGEREQALRYWRDILDVEPLNLEAHRTLALLLSEMGAREDAVEHLQAYCTRFPHHFGLHQALYEWDTEGTAAERETVLRKLVAIDPLDAWTRRELALNLNRQARFDEAVAAADEGIALDTNQSASYGIKAFVLKTCGRREESYAYYRQAIERSADAFDAIQGLLDVCGEAAAERKDAVNFVLSQIETQGVVGDGVLAFRATARGVLTPDELLAALRRLHDQRPDLWQTSSALMRHLTQMGHTEEALAIATTALARFASVAQLWLEASVVHRTRLDTAAEIAALERCRELKPEWVEAGLTLVDALDRAGRQLDAEQLCETMIARTPLAPEPRVRIAELWQRRGETERALERVREALRITPDSSWAWEAFVDLRVAIGETQQSLELIRAFAESRPRETHAWLRLAELALRLERPQDALLAAERAIAINPRQATAYDYKALILAELRQFRAASDACSPAALQGSVPVYLEGRSTWVEAQRGDLNGAIERMSALVHRAPDYQWGWAQLVEWNANAGRLQEAATAATNWAWLEPSNLAPLGWLGDLRTRMNDRAGAKEVFHRAMRLQPSYVFAGQRYFHLLKEDGDHDGAARTLEILRPYVSASVAAAMRVELEAARSNIDAALAAVIEMCRDPSCDGAVLADVADVFSSNNAALRRLERMLVEVLGERTWNAATPTLWARVRIRRGRFGNPWRYRWLVRLGDPAKTAVHELLGAIGQRAQQTAGRVAYGLYLDAHITLLRWTCAALRGDDMVWGKMSFALAARGRSRTVIRWMRDWRERPGVAAWMLQNLTLALLVRRRDREALAVLQHVVKTFAVTEDVGHTLRLWATLGACVDGELEIADRLLHETPAEAVPSGDRWARTFAETALALLRASPRSTMTDEQQRVLKAASYHSSTKAIGRLVALVRYRLAQHTGSPWRRIAAWSRLHLRVSPTVLVVVILIVLRLAFVLA